VSRSAEGTDALGRLRARAQRRSIPRPGETCELCSEAITEEHGHLVNVETRSLLCVCSGCFLPFTPGGAGGRTYRAVPQRYRRLDGGAYLEAAWEALQIPVDIAFLFFNSALEKLLTFYPGPAGATGPHLPAGAWDEMTKALSLREVLQPDVEALLLARRDGVSVCYLVPIDACYELVGRMRRLWRGFDGGKDVANEIDAFFDMLATRVERDAAADGPP